MLDTIITQYIKKNNIKKFDVEEKVWTNNNWSNSLRLGKDIAFFYEMNIICAVSSVSDFSKGLFSLESPDNKINYKNIVKAIDIAGAVQLTSNYISVHHSEVEHVVDSTTVYSSIYSGYYKYVLLKILE